MDAIFTLGGGSFDRGNEAAKLFKEGYADLIVCTGGQIPNVLKALNFHLKEAHIAKINLIKNNNISVKNIDFIAEGTSTKEESELILKYCKEHEFEKVIILSTKFHTKRVKNVFVAILEENGIEPIVRGAPSSNYDEDYWWQTEAGMIMVNNEYVKIVYYILKY